jgi:hypothetical protein
VEGAPTEEAEARRKTQATRGANDPPQGQLVFSVLLFVC